MVRLLTTAAFETNPILKHLLGMGYRLEIDTARNLVRETWSGAVTLEDYQLAAIELKRHPAYCPGMDGLTDYRNAEIQLSYEAMKRLAGSCASERWGRVAIVVSRTVDYGLARMYRALTEFQGSHIQHFEIFFSLPEADKWLSSRDQGAATTKASRSFAI